MLEGKRGRWGGGEGERERMIDGDWIWMGLCAVVVIFELFWWVIIMIGV